MTVVLASATATAALAAPAPDELDEAPDVPVVMTQQALAKARLPARRFPSDRCDHADYSTVVANPSGTLTLTPPRAGPQAGR